MDFRNKRVTVMGLGSFGGQIAAIRFLADQGARQIIVTDSKPAEQLAEGLAQIADVPNVTLRLGGHNADDFAGVDAIVVSPAVPKDHPMLAVARQRGVPQTSEMNLFFERCRGRIVGITGSAGKSTTTAMIEAVLTGNIPADSADYTDFEKKEESAKSGKSVGNPAVHLGGNIGHRALLPRVGQIRPQDTVILELSSFQLEDLGELNRSPAVAVVTNIAPNHLDRHGTMAEYVRCKQNILRFQRPEDVAILNGEDAALVGRAGPSSAPATPGWDSITRAQVRWYHAEDAAPLTLQVVGRHNRLNAAAAVAVGRSFGLPEATIAAALAGFAALPHRLELVGRAGGVRYFNDSKATTPESTLTALAAFEDEHAPVILIVGGYDKHIDLAPLCRELASRAKAVLAIGQTGPRFVELVGMARIAGAGDGPAHIDSGAGDGPAHNSGGAVVQLAGDLATAVRLAAGLAAPGDVVLLSPASASYGQFTNYEERGERFGKLVGQLG